jgi:hypothetical protein
MREIFILNDIWAQDKIYFFVGTIMRVSENRVLRRIFGSKRDEVTGEWRKLHNEELHNLYSSQNIIRQIKSRRMRWAGHVARMREKSVQGFGGKARRKETTGKTKA